MDIATYNAAESVAVQGLSDWTLRRAFSPVWFEASTFQTRVATVHELLGILDSMHDRRFEAFVAERGGYSDQEFESLVAALARFVAWHQRQFPYAPVRVPLDAMAAHLMIHRKLRALPARRRVLEIGPGCGYLSFFLADDPEVEFYAQLEITQSFYILQSLIDSEVFGGGFENRAMLLPPRPALGAHLVAGGIRERGDPLDIPAPAVRCRQHPWWDVDTALDDGPWDVVMMNANLGEMDRTARRYYLGSLKKILAPRGLLFVHCFGHMANEDETKDEIRKDLIDAQLRPMLFVGRSAMFQTIAPARWNALFVGPQHPLHADCPVSIDREIALRNDPATNAFLGLDGAARHPVSRGDVLRSLAERCGSRGPRAS